MKSFIFHQKSWMYDKYIYCCINIDMILTNSTFTGQFLDPDYWLRNTTEGFFFFSVLARRIHKILFSWPGHSLYIVDPDSEVLA